MDALFISGNGTDKKVLEEVNPSDADVFVATTGNDGANLLTCIMAKGYNIPKVFARVNDPTHGKAFKHAGIDSVVSPELSAASHLEKLIIRPKIADLVIIGKGNAELLDITVTNKRIFGKKTCELSPTKDFIINAIHENGDIIIPDNNTTLKEGCKISILVKTNAVEQVEKLFT